MNVGIAVVASAADPEADAVIEAARAGGIDAIRFNLDDQRDISQRAVGGALDLLLGGEWRRLSSSTTVWWHRSGTVDTSGLDREEAALAVDEGPHLLRGALAAASVRWVDDPFTVERAETKLHQLALVGTTPAPWGKIVVPDWVVTNDPEEARCFAQHRRVVAKPVSPGVGIVPFVAEVGGADLDMVRGNPVLLQALVPANADLRVVTVSGSAWVWSRKRMKDTIDWRAEDPGGQAFKPVEHDGLARAAVSITSALGLTMSVQDWLATKGGPVFLEVNPQGAWLFLARADELVVPAVVTHLFTRPGSAGYWPPALRRFGWDLGRGQKAPENDGVVAPVYNEPPWIDEAATCPGAVDVARRAHDAAAEGAKRAEEKAARLVPAALALLTVTIAVGTYQLDFALRRGWPWAPTILPVATAIVCLALAAFEALEIDRVGVYGRVTGADLAGIGRRDATAALLAREEDARRLAAWTSQHKHSDPMQARAWFARAVAALLMAGLVAGVCKAGTSASQHASGSAGSTTTTTTRPVPPTSAQR